MSKARSSPFNPSLARWIARIWSLPIFVFVLLKIFTPDPTIVAPVPPLDWFLLSLWGCAVLGLAISWRWETLGAIITIGIMFLREIAWVLLRGPWIPNFLIVWALLVPPAILFLISGRAERKTH